VRSYRHSAYWYAYHEGKTYSEHGSFAGSYFDMHRRRGRYIEKTTLFGKKKTVWQEPELFDNFNPLIFGACIMLDIGVAMREEVRKWADPDERAKMANDLRRELRIVRRPFYYARETERRRQLAIERRKIRRRRTLAPTPTPEEVLEAWIVRNDSKENMIRLGGMLHDLECYVDNCLKYNERGDLVGRNRGIKGWIDENIPELSGKYKTLMRYKAMAIKLRQATETKDPVPTARLLDEPQSEIVRELMGDFRTGFSSLERGIEFHLNPERVMWKKSEDEIEEKVMKKRAKIRKNGGKATDGRRGKRRVDAYGGPIRRERSEEEILDLLTFEEFDRGPQTDSLAVARSGGAAAKGGTANGERSGGAAKGEEAVGTRKREGDSKRTTARRDSKRTTARRAGAGQSAAKSRKSTGGRDGRAAEQDEKPITKRQREREYFEAALADMRLRHELEELRLEDFA